MRAVWRCSTTAPGERYATTRWISTWRRWCASSWASSGASPGRTVPNSARAKVRLVSILADVSDRATTKKKTRKKKTRTVIGPAMLTAMLTFDWLQVLPSNCRFLEIFLFSQPLPLTVSSISISGALVPGEWVHHFMPFLTATLRSRYTQ